VYAIVAACAVGAAGLTIGITLATRTPTPAQPAGQSGSPPLVLDLGVRTDREAVALRRAANLYNGGKHAKAARIFDRYGTAEAQVGAALSAWPGGFAQLAALAGDRPRSAVTQLNYGLGLYWRGDVPAAQAAWRTVRKAHPDTAYAERAEDLLYPNFPRGVPTFVPGFPSPPVLDRLSPPKQLAYLERLAATGGERGKLLYGVALQRLGRRISALREFEQAAALAPTDPEPQVAAAVARFDKADPSQAFSRLGPLSKRYPKSQSVRFHLGLALLWLADVTQARKELELARDLGPQTRLGSEAQKFLDSLAGIKTG
jgi:tetratricopeptide (TPR) repeat protein